MLTISLPSRSTSLITQVQTVVDVIGSLEKHVERQQSENRETTASASVNEEDNEEELNVEESWAGGDDLVQHNNDVTGDDGNASPVLAAAAIPTSEVVGGKSGQWSRILYSKKQETSQASTFYSACNVRRGRRSSANTSSKKVCEGGNDQGSRSVIHISTWLRTTYTGRCSIIYSHGRCLITYSHPLRK